MRYAMVDYGQVSLREVRSTVGDDLLGRAPIPCSIVMTWAAVGFVVVYYGPFRYGARSGMISPAVRQCGTVRVTCGAIRKRGVRFGYLLAREVRGTVGDDSAVRQMSSSLFWFRMLRYGLACGVGCRGVSCRPVALVKVRRTTGDDFPGRALHPVGLCAVALRGVWSDLVQSDEVRARSEMISSAVRQCGIVRLGDVAYGPVWEGSVQFVSVRGTAGDDLPGRAPMRCCALRFVGRCRVG